jgi:phage baseplate assembly protein W
MTTYRGFNTIGKDFGAVSISDIELVKRDLLNHFSIRKGEKLQNPNYGSSIHDLIMEPLTEEVKSLITDEINNVINSDPRVVAQGIIIDEFANGVQAQVNLLYRLTDQTETMLFTFNKQDGTVS